MTPASGTPDLRACSLSVSTNRNATIVAGPEASRPYNSVWAKSNLCESKPAFASLTSLASRGSDLPQIQGPFGTILSAKVSRASACLHSNTTQPMGAGLAGGDWQTISAIIEDELCSHGVNVTVYDLP